MIGDRVTRYLREHSIEYIERGPDVAKGNVNIRCPWCGEADIGHHLGINLRNGYYGCWRSKAHRGKDVSNLLSALTGESKKSLRELVYGNEISVNQDTFSQIANGMFYNDAPVSGSKSKDKVLVLPKKFTLLRRYGTTDRFWKYLSITRKFGNEYTDKVASRYKLRVCFTGAFKDRIIMPIYMGKELVCWTSRSIHTEAQVRYMALPDQPAQEGNLDIGAECGLALVNVKNTLFNYDLACKGGKLLIVEEGPLDVIKVDVVGWRFGVRAVGLFNTAATQEQVLLLKELSRLYEKVLVILDVGFVTDALSVANSIGRNATAVAFESLPVPKYATDLGDLKMPDASKLIKYLLKRYTA